MSAKHGIVVDTRAQIYILVKVGGLPFAACLTPYEHGTASYMFCRMDKHPAPTIRDLYPHFTDEQLAEAEDAFERYLTLVLGIFERRELQRAKQLTEDSDEIPCEASASNDP